MTNGESSVTETGRFPVPGAGSRAAFYFILITVTMGKPFLAALGMTRLLRSGYGGQRVCGLAETVKAAARLPHSK